VGQRKTLPRDSVPSPAHRRSRRVRSQEALPPHADNASSFPLPRESPQQGVQEQEDLGALLSQRLRTVSGARAITSFSKTRKAATRAETPVAACANHGSESVTESISPCTSNCRASRFAPAATQNPPPVATPNSSTPG